MEESILKEVKGKLSVNIDMEDTTFDEEIMADINAALSILVQLGVGPPDGFCVTGTTELWSDFLGDNKQLELAKTYVYLKVRLLFDPPSSSAVNERFKELAKEYEWRLNEIAERTAEEESS